MAFPAVVSEVSSQQDTNATTHTVTMPPSIVAGNLLVLAWVIDGRENVSGQIADDWVQIANTAHSGDLASIRVFTKTATGSEGASQSITITSAQCSAHHVWQISGWSGTPEAAIFQGNVDTSLDPPALNPTAWDVEDTLWLALSASDDATSTITGFPSSYTGTGQVNAGDSADGCTLGYARRNNATASEDPGAFTLSSAEGFCTVTVGIRPASPVSFVAVGAKSAGSATAPSIAYPGSIAAGQMILAGRAGWRSDITMANESGWTNTSELGGGTGTAIDAHTTKIRVDRQIAAGSESGSVTFDCSGSTNPGCLGIMANYAKSPSTATWDVAQTTGDDATHGTNRSVTGSGAISFQPGDVLTAWVATDTDTNLAGFSSPALTASGITFGTTTRRSPASAGVTTGDDGNIEMFEATVTAGTGTVAPTLAFTTSTSQCGPVSFVRLRAVSGLSATLGQAVETNTAQALAELKSKAIGQASETDTAQPVRGMRFRLLGQATEIDIAGSITHPKSRTVGQVTETQTAQPITRRKVRAIAQVSEADVAQAVAHSRTRALLQVLETTTAQPLSRSKAKAIGQRTETSTAQAVAHSKLRALGQASEVDQAHPLAGNLTIVIGRATETDTALSVSRSKIESIGQALELSTAQSLTRTKQRALGQVLETSQAQQLSAGRAILLGQPVELSVAHALARSKLVVVGQALEVATAFPILAVGLPVVVVDLVAGELEYITEAGELEPLVYEAIELVELFTAGELEGG